MKNRKEGQMSNEWTMVRLEDVCNKASSNISLNKVAGDLGEYPLFGASGLAKNIDFYHQEKEYIAIVKDGAGVGRVMMLPSKSSIVGTMQYLLPKSNIHINYLCYILKQLDLAKYASGATIPHIYFKDYSKEDVFLPPIAKQREIAEVLDKASELVEKRKAQLAELDLLAESVFYDMFGDPVANPKGWKKSTVGQLSYVGTGGTPDRQQAEKYYNGHIPWVKTTEVQNSTILSTEEKITDLALKNSNCKVYPPNTILLAMYGQGKTRGQVAKLGISAATNQACAAIIPSKDINIDYLYSHLLISYNEIRSLGRGGNQENLNLSLVKSIGISLPLLELQQQFAERIEKIEEQKTKAKEALKESENLFQRLMQDMFNPDYHNS